MRFSRHFSGWNAVSDDLQCKITNTALDFVECHRDLGVLINRGLKFHNHVGDVVRKAAGLANSLLRSTVNRSPEFMVALFVTHIRQILDSCSCVWNVGYVGDVPLLESIQRSWTKKIDGMHNLSYGERLRSLQLFSIKGRHLRSDLIKHWMIFCCDLARFDLSVLFQRSREERTRGHRFKLVMPPCNTDVRQRFFYVHCIKIWNSLPNAVVESQSVASFKSLLSEFLGAVLFFLILTLS